MINDLALLREVAYEIGAARHCVTELNRRRTVEKTFPSAPISAAYAGSGWPIDRTPSARSLTSNLPSRPS